MNRWIPTCGLLALLAPAATMAQQAAPVPAAPAAPTPIQLASQADHKQMLEQLHIASLRPGANARDEKAANYAVYDEAKINTYPALPDPLTLKNGKKVKSAKDWWEKRRPEIVEDFDREV